MKLHLDGAEYELVQPNDMKMREQREFEKIADAGVDAIGRLDEDYRAAVVVAWMAVSIHRARPTTPMRQIVDRLDDLDSDELQEVWAEAVEADQAGQNPPELGERSDDSSESKTPTGESSPALSVIDPEPTIPSGTGDPGSESHPRRSAI